MVVLDGKKTAQDLKEEIKITVSEIRKDGQRSPHLAAILVGNDGASLTYVGSKVRSCKYVGFNSTLIHLDESTSEEILLKKITELNQDDELDGYIVQLPLPNHINEEKILLAIDPKKDVDGFHPSNFGRMALEMDAFIPATPFGIMELLERYQIETTGKHCVVIGRSHIVGRPISILMSQKGQAGNATVTVAHSRTQDLVSLTKNADIIVMALGIPEYLRADMIKKGVTVIDVGITRVVDENHPKGYIIKGDVAYDEVAAKAAAITPVPGGVGPMTIAMLLKNTLIAFQRKN
ncbi:bifunctional 5,10-methylenetetrahydrofolate dehydrogenase/5,10-methenyltetrahydrofolate cyclohydrolase [Flavobacteriaceae bacterium]|jgi:methylenetetrahydrofolate dehydrogenase (NADP+)/methenyltetrahydrofolate cyclohydrolase|nr:bifunctional 5,10-methylenetetrahydrofolate dehydrogenase/5,10-methenyltetrahydrofolate cyclohydrolase [Flavobacteriaceae bacterium]